MYDHAVSSVSAASSSCLRFSIATLSLYRAAVEVFAGANVFPLTV